MVWLQDLTLRLKHISHRADDTPSNPLITECLNIPYIIWFFGIVTTHSLGSESKKWRKATKSWGNDAKLWGKSAKLWWNNSKLWGNEAKLWGSEAKVHGELRQRQSDSIPPHTPTRRPCKPLQTPIYILPPSMKLGWVSKSSQHRVREALVRWKIVFEQNILYRVPIFPGHTVILTMI